MSQRTSSDVIAAVDLGSNSFHLVVARRVEDELQVVDRRRERVALAAGVDARKRLTEEVQERALATLERFGERLRSMPRGSVRVVGTSALRVARNSREFLGRAAEALGHPVEIISGSEEARLIYLGVAHDLSDDSQRRLVIDVGGGSTECILGKRFEALRTDSVHMGCVNWSLRFFPGGELSARAMEQAVIAARLEVRTFESLYRDMGWKDCIGSSGTIVATEQILRESGWSEEGITDKGLRRLRREIASAGRVERLVLPGLQPDRAPVIAGGVAILSALFEGLRIEHMRVSQGALREGVLYDLLGRIRHEDVRYRTIRNLAERYVVDRAQAERVRHTALELFEQAREGWSLDEGSGREFLEWAARLHEIGLALSYSGYHKHGAYLVEHSDMPGFSREDQLVLAAMIGSHRRRLTTERLDELPISLQKPTLRVTLILRLAVLLNRSRSEPVLPAPRLLATKGGCTLELPRGWNEANPLALADLEEEARYVRAVGLELLLA